MWGKMVKEKHLDQVGIRIIDLANHGDRKSTEQAFFLPDRVGTIGQNNPPLICRPAPGLRLVEASLRLGEKMGMTSARYRNCSSIRM